MNKFNIMQGSYVNRGKSHISILAISKEYELSILTKVPTLMLFFFAISIILDLSSDLIFGPNIIERDFNSTIFVLFIPEVF